MASGFADALPPPDRAQGLHGAGGHRGLCCPSHRGRTLQVRGGQPGYPGGDGALQRLLRRLPGPATHRSALSEAGHLQDAARDFDASGGLAGWRGTSDPGCARGYVRHAASRSQHSGQNRRRHAAGVDGDERPPAALRQRQGPSGHELRRQRRIARGEGPGRAGHRPPWRTVALQQLC